MGGGVNAWRCEEVEAWRRRGVEVRGVEVRGCGGVSSGVWRCGGVEGWEEWMCGCVDEWMCGCVEVWVCGGAEVRRCWCVGAWS
eukprot:1353518-Alexandrium_andersonii.AAC.1